MTLAVTHDAFLGGRLTLWQPKIGYRAGTDPVLLAAAVRAQPGQSVLDVGCGVGTAGFCVAKRVSGLRLTGLEIQDDYAQLARRNASENGISARIVTGRLEAMPDDLRSEVFDHVITNPPFYAKASHTSPMDEGRKTAHIENLQSLSDWCRNCLKRVRQKGRFTLIHRIEALPQLLAILSDVCGDIEVFPIASRLDRPAGRVIVSARKATSGALTLHPFLLMHDGVTHGSDCNDYSERAEAILRHGSALI